MKKKHDSPLLSHYSPLLTIINQNLVVVGVGVGVVVHNLSALTRSPLHLPGSADFLVQMALEWP